MAKPTPKQIGKEFLEQLLHDWMEPLAKFLVKHGIRVDQPWEKLVLALSPLLQAYITATYKKDIDAETIVGWFAEISEELIMELKQELARASKEGVEPDKGKAAEASISYVRKLMFSPAHPGVVFHLGCNATHHLEATVVETTDDQGKKHKKASTKHREDFCLVAPEEVAALLKKGGRTPTSTEDGATSNCTCETLVRDEMAAYEKQKTKDTPKPIKEPLFTRDEKRAAVRSVFGAAGSAVGAVASVAGSVKSGVAGIVKAAGDGRAFNFEQKNKTDLMRERLARLKAEAAEAE